MVTSTGDLATGKAAIRENLMPFLALKLPIQFETPKAIEADGVAFLSVRWLVEGDGPDGKPMKLSGTSSEVVRRQQDGSWLYIIDDLGVDP